jgi:hypothetical protein
LAGWLVGVPAALGADFRIENKVFSENRKEPVSQSTTVFHQGMVYDFMQDPDEAIVFDKAGGRFALLDMRRRVRAELTTNDVAAFTQRLRQWAEGQKDPLVKFMAAPKFDEQFETRGLKLTLSSPGMTYRIQASAADKTGEISKQNREFSDWLAQLNAMLNPGGRLPFPRIAANGALARRGLIPQEVTLTTNPKQGSDAKPTTVRSEHQLVKPLTKTDLERIQQARQSMGAFKRVSFEEYRKTPQR